MRQSSDKEGLIAAIDSLKLKLNTSRISQQRSSPTLREMINVGGYDVEIVITTNRMLGNCYAIYVYASYGSRYIWFGAFDSVNESPPKGVLAKIKLGLVKGLYGKET